MLCTGNATFQFTDQSTGNITGWAWDFGDKIFGTPGNSTSIEQNPTHTYTRNGVYEVTLTITTPICENKVTKVNYISITGCPADGSHT
jgi:PKD repeat protein